MYIVNFSFYEFLFYFKYKNLIYLIKPFDTNEFWFLSSSALNLAKIAKQTHFEAITYVQE